MYNKIYKLFFLSVLLAFSSACSDDFLDVNENPNSPVNVPVAQRLPAALVNTANLEAGALNQLGAVWTGYWSKASDGPGVNSLFRLEETYGVEAMAFDRDGRPIWEDTYTTLVNYKDIEKSALENGDMAYAGIAKIMQGWHFLRLVDLYNNIPFSEALQGGSQPTPRYEEGRQVYAGSLDLISEGINDIKAASALSKMPAGDDVLFGGDLKLWVKFANTIKLRALLRQSEIEMDAYIAGELALIAQEGSGFLGAGENAFVNPGYLVTAGKQSPFWDAYYKDAAGATSSNYNTLRPTEFVITQYQQHHDPRLGKLYKAVDGNYKGVPLGLSNDPEKEYTMAATSALLSPEDNGGQPAALLKSAGQPAVLMGAFESLFLQAEAAERGWISGSAAGFYEQAVQESLRYMEVEEAEIAPYLQQPTVELAEAANRMERIMEQKWLALNSISSIEAWNDYRRLDFPANLPQSLQSPSADPAYRPLRLTYRQSEVSGNGDEVARQGNINPFRSRIFWDKE